MIPNPMPAVVRGYREKSPVMSDEKGGNTESDAEGEGGILGDDRPRRADSVFQTGCLGDR